MDHPQLGVSGFLSYEDHDVHFGGYSYLSASMGSTFVARRAGR